MCEAEALRKVNKKEKNINKLMKPFNMLITGATDSGKSYYLLKMLEEECAQQFGNIFLICPTFEWNTTYRNWKYINEPNFYVIPCDHDQVEIYLKFIVDYCKGIPPLIILDDCANSLSVKSRTSELVRLGFSGRHMSISTIVVTQQFTSITKPYRENISKLIIFYTGDIYDLDFVLRKYVRDDKKKKREITEVLTKVDYSYLKINLGKPYSYKIVT